MALYGFGIFNRVMILVSLKKVGILPMVKNSFIAEQTSGPIACYVAL